MNRGSITERVGIYLTGLRITKLGWVFRELTTMDYGVDATIEQRKNDIPTGKFISAQIKTGNSFVQTNLNGDIDFYIKPVHLSYWLSYQMPVILILCDPDKEILYWKQIVKRNLTQTKDGKYKISIPKTSMMNIESLEELEVIINTYSPTNNFDVDISTMTTQEVADYASELIGHSRDSISSIRVALEKHQESTEKWRVGLEQLQADLTSDRIRSDSDKNQRIKMIGQKYKIAANILTQRLIGNEKQIAIDTHTSALCFIDKVLCDPEIDIQIFAQLVVRELDSERNSITGVIELLNQFATQCESSDKGWGSQFISGMKSCAIALKDYAADLEFFSDIITKQIEKLHLPTQPSNV